jgi:hypothetical protein
MFDLKMGTWAVQCESDPRWNKSGRAEGLVSLGGPQEMQDWIKECYNKFGEAPEDATKSFMKD